MRVLVVSGIWPPDVGGPASHAPEVADFLLARGHRVEVVTTADSAPAARPYPVRFVPRSVPVGLRHLRAAALISRRAKENDVVYATGMLGRTTAACAVARRPFVAKLTQDPAFERALRRGHYTGSLEEFQHRRVGLTAALLRRARDFELHRAAHVICPSGFLAGLTVGWGVPPSRVSVLPNPTPPLPALPDWTPGSTLAFAGRLTAPKDLGVALDSLAACEGVTLRLAGDGDERAALEARAAGLGLGDRVEFLGALGRDDVLALFRRADAAILSSAWENFPHTVVEALAVGTPVIATAVGGVPEIVTDGENGLLVPPGDPPALARAIRRFCAEPELRERLRAAAVPSVERFAPEHVYGELERILEAAAR
ncbi:MAG: glycosyltransferase family 4 protein [Gaiellaceae bacterium]